ncbi:hypothetical protein ACQY0O_005951 [Thecaphora frezii]
MSSSSSAYSYRPGGSLKFKGSSSDDKKDKKKKKKSKSSTSSDLKKSSGSNSSISKGHGDDKAAEEQRIEADLMAQIEEKEAELASSGRPMTESERKFEEMRKKRMHERIRKEAKMSHKEKVDAFNQYLLSLSEHHDIPKVGPG